MARDPPKGPAPKGVRYFRGKKKQVKKVTAKRPGTKRKKQQSKEPVRDKPIKERKEKRIVKQKMTKAEKIADAMKRGCRINPETNKPILIGSPTDLKLRKKGL